jgi:hypothetical protein
MLAVLAPLALLAGIQEPKSVQELAAALRTAHGISAQDAQADRFEARLQLTPQRAGDAEKITVSLDVRFWQRSRTDATKRDLIRYRIDEGGETLERGRDARGMWSRAGKEEFNLGAREHQTDRETLEQHMRLASQLLELLDPERLVGRLAGAGPVRAEKLTIGRREAIECEALEGNLADFPTYASGGVGRSVRLKLWVEKATGLLHAVEAHPLDAAGRPLPRAELVVLRDYRAPDRLRLPSQLTIFQVEGGQRVPSVTVDLKKLELGPELDEATFDRRRRW